METQQRPLIDLGPASYAGPVARAFELCLKPVAVIVGSTGCGKTQAAARKIIRVALNQYPSPKDGVRKARIVVVCPTYRRGWDTVIPSYKKVWGSICPDGFKGAKGDPLDHVIDFPYGEARLHIEVLFRAVRDESLEEFVRGFETTAWWFPEMDTMPAEDLLSLASNRVGRYPEPDDRPELPAGATPAYGGVWGDANAPVIDTWFYNRFYLNHEQYKATDALFRQPAALLADGSVNPRAENLHNLRKIRPDYFENLASTMEDYDIGRLLKNNPGWSRLGKPVFEDFDDQTMVSALPLEADPRLPLVIGADVGSSLKPAAMFMQRTAGGEVRILDEITNKAGNADLITFGEEVRRVVDTRFAAVRDNIVIVADPAAMAQTSAARNKSYAQLLQGSSGIAVRPAPTNDVSKRLTAVRQVLKRRAGATMLIDSRCLGAIAAMSGGYHYRKTGNAYAPLPEKRSDHADPADAIQYGVLGLEGLGAVAGGVISPSAGAGQYDGQSIIPA